MRELIIALTIALAGCAGPQQTKVYGPMQLGPTQLYCGVDEEGQKYFCTVSRGRRTCTKVQVCQMP